MEDLITLVSQCEDAPEWVLQLIGRRSSKNFDTDVAELRRSRQYKMVVKSSCDLIFVKISCSISLKKKSFRIDSILFHGLKLCLL